MNFAELPLGYCFRFHNQIHSKEIYAKTSETHYRLAIAGIHSRSLSITDLPEQTFEIIETIEYSTPAAPRN